MSFADRILPFLPLSWRYFGDGDGVGKSFVACALAQKACRDGYSALYTRAQSLFRDLAMARADGSLRSLLAPISRIDVLVIDDWAMAHSQNPSAATSGRSAKTATKCARPSSPRNCRSLAGTSRSAIPRWPTASSTGWSTMPTGSRGKTIRCGICENHSAQSIKIVRKIKLM
jgi:IstB-like ATP binding protein